MYSFVQHKGKKVYTLCVLYRKQRDTRCYTMGSRSKARIKDLLKRLQGIRIDFYLADGWQAFKSCLPYFQHLVGKCFTKGIEGRNTWIRRRLARLFRRSTTFSKKVIYTLKYSSWLIKINYHTFETTTTY